MVIHGGACGGGDMADEYLFLLDMKNGESKSNWMIVPCTGESPGKRYGHTLVYKKPYIILFGGNSSNELKNDAWVLSIEIIPFVWTKISFPSHKQPSPRVYHSATLCTKGAAAGMMIIFGGRVADPSTISDIWGLTRHSNGKFEWIKAPIKVKPDDQPTDRHQVAYNYRFSILDYFWVLIY